MAEAKSRDIPQLYLKNENLFLLGQGCRQQLISASLTGQTSCLGVDNASNKDQTKNILAAAFIPVPQGKVVDSMRKLNRAIDELGYPLVIKPLDSNHGRGITTYISTAEKASIAYQAAKKFSNSVIVEHFIKGDDYRFLVVNYKLAAVAKRIPAAVTGDGMSTIKELIELANQDSRRGHNHDNFLTIIEVDETALSLLKEANLSLDSVLPKAKTIFLKYAANLSSGGTAVDVTETVHPKIIFLMERIARLMNLDICGIDVIAERIDIPLTEENGAVIEVNAAPGLRMHLLPSEGKSRNVAKNIIDMLFPEGRRSRIPIVAVTGTNGKTTVVRLIAQLAGQAGHTVGYSTTDGIYIDKDLIFRGDCSGPQGAQTVLRDPLIDFAVLECARGGILRSGLGFDKCNVSILTNISPDHLGMHGINTLEQLVRVKSVVLRSTADDGYAILNADDELVFSLKEDLYCNIALFSVHSDNPRIREHIEEGGTAIYIEDNEIIINHSDNKIIFGNIIDFPLTFLGAAKNMVKNLLPAILAGVLSGFKCEDIYQLLKNLRTTAELFPGRMNLFHIHDFEILVDYGHNIGALTELKEFLNKVNCNRKIGIFGAPGDRRPEDIINLGVCCGEMLDEIIIRQDKDGRGKSSEEIASLLIEGIKSAGSQIKISLISDEQEALDYAMQQAKANDLILYFPEDIFKAIHYLNSLTRSQPSTVQAVPNG